MGARWLHESTSPVTVNVLTAQAVSIGDLIGMSSGNAIRASDQAWTTDEATTRAAFVALFVGISGQDKAAGTARPYGNSNDNTLRVDTEGIYEFDCVSGTYAVGDKVGPAKDTGNALLPSTLKAVSTEGESVGRVVEAGTSVTKVKVKLHSRITPAATPG